MAAIVQYAEGNSAWLTWKLTTSNHVLNVAVRSLVTFSWFAHDVTRKRVAELRGRPPQLRERPPPLRERVALLVESEGKSGGSMRIAAGIMLIVLGIALTYVQVGLMTYDIIHYGVPVSQYLLSPYIVMVFPGVFSTICGGLCVKRRYWKVCFSSALLLLLMMIYWCVVTGGGAWFAIPLGIAPLIFVLLRKRDWQKSQA